MRSLRRRANAFAGFRWRIKLPSRDHHEMQRHRPPHKIQLALREGAAGKTIERRVTLSESLDAAQNAKLSEVCERTPVTLAVKSGIDMHTTIESKAPTPL